MASEDFCDLLQIRLRITFGHFWLAWLHDFSSIPRRILSSIEDRRFLGYWIKWMSDMVQVVLRRMLVECASCRWPLVGSLNARVDTPQSSVVDGNIEVVRSALEDNVERWVPRSTFSTSSGQLCKAAASLHPTYMKVNWKENDLVDVHARCT